MRRKEKEQGVEEGKASGARGNQGKTPIHIKSESCVQGSKEGLDKKKEDRSFCYLRRGNQRGSLKK